MKKGPGSRLLGSATVLTYVSPLQRNAVSQFVLFMSDDVAYYGNKAIFKA